MCFKRFDFTSIFCTGFELIVKVNKMKKKPFLFYLHFFFIDFFYSFYILSITKFILIFWYHPSHDSNLKPSVYKFTTLLTDLIHNNTNVFLIALITKFSKIKLFEFFYFSLFKLKTSQPTRLER